MTFQQAFAPITSEAECRGVERFGNPEVGGGGYVRSEKPMRLSVGIHLLEPLPVNFHRAITLHNGRCALLENQPYVFRLMHEWRIVAIAMHP